MYRHFRKCFPKSVRMNDGGTNPLNGTASPDTGALKPIIAQKQCAVNKDRSSFIGVPLKKRSDAIKHKSHRNSALSVLLRKWDSGYTA